jgi:hypothetical protein
VLAVCGTLAPIAFALATLAVGLVHPQYSHLSDWVSELGERGAPGASVMNYAGFLLFGILIVGFAFGLHRGIRAGPGDWLGPAVLGLYGAAYILVAFAPCDPGCVPDAPSLRQEVHYVLGRIIAVTAVGAPAALYARLARDDRWARWRVPVLGLPVLGWVSWLTLQFELPSVPIGLRQRLWLALTLAGIEMLALRLVWLSGTRWRSSLPSGD